MSMIPALSLVFQLVFLWLAWRNRHRAESGYFAPASAFFGGISFAYLLY